MSTYRDKELILVSDMANKASDKYNKRLTPNTFSIIKIVEDFISSNNLICYGGIAINNILPKKEQFYKLSEFPDYDFFSPDALNDAKKLADIYHKKGYGNIEAKSGFHYGTYKVYVNFLNIADITQIDPEIYNNIKKLAIKKNKILYSPPDFLRMSMYLELSRPKGDVSRWEKILPRLNLLNKYYPIKNTICKNRNEKLSGLKLNIYNTVKSLLINQKVIFFGGYADRLYSKYSKNKSQISKLMIYDVLSNDAKICSETIKTKMKEFDITIDHIDKIGELIPEHYSLKVDGKIYVNIYQSEACYTYNRIKIENKSMNIATIFTMMSLYLIFIFADNPTYDTSRIMCTANMLQKIYERNKFKNSGLLKVYTIECLGEQETFEDILLKKRDAFKKVKKTDTKYEKWFMKYIPK